MPTNLCTYFDSKYLPQGIALLRSIMRHVPDWRLWVLALDQWTLDVMGEIARALPSAGRLTVIPLSELEHQHPTLIDNAKLHRSYSEYIFTLTPVWALYALGVSGLGSVAYIDADCWFLSDPSPLYAEVGDAPVAIIPHRWTPRHADRLRANGTYNVGWVYFRNSRGGLRCAEAWLRDCFAWRPTPDQPRFSDQVYLDDWPAKFGAHIVQHPGANLAPWSAEQYEYMTVDYRGAESLLIASPVIRDGILAHDGMPILFYHFHEWRRDRLGQVYRTGYPIPAPIAQHIYNPYEAEIADVFSRLYA